jgi:transposase-like protein
VSLGGIVMSSVKKKERRVWTPARKLQVVLEALSSEAKVAEICRREGLSPTQVYGWRKQLMGAAESVFVRKQGKNAADPKLERLAAENVRMKSVIAEITAENLDLKKAPLD